MHWQYYQKAIAAYFAASNALTVKAQEQQPFVLPGDGGISLSVQYIDFGKARKLTVCSLALQHLVESLIESVLGETDMKSSTLLY
jgi:hypothetical protein